MLSLNFRTSLIAEKLEHRYSTHQIEHKIRRLKESAARPIMIERHMLRRAWRGLAPDFR